MTHSGDESQFIVVVQRRRIEANQNAGWHARHVVTGKRDGLQPLRTGDEHALGRAPADLRAECHTSRRV